MAKPCGCGKPSSAAAAIATLESETQTKAVALVHKYPPSHNAGAEWMLHHTLRYLNAHGAESRVLTTQAVRLNGEVFDGVHVTSQPRSSQLTTWGRWGNVVITHLDATAAAMQFANRYRLPEMHLVHNHRQLDYHHVKPAEQRVAVFNSEWLRDAAGWEGRSLILHPPVPPDYYFIEDHPGDAVLFVNRTAAKGAHLVYALAEKLPKVRFLAVTGAYGQQVLPPDLPNLQIVPPVPGLRPYLQQAAVVVMPSSYESWGRIAVEAACSGIPSIVADTPGLVEAMGDAAIVLPITTKPLGSVGGRTTDSVEADDKTINAWAAAVTDVLADPAPLGRAAIQRAYQLWSETLGQLSVVDATLHELTSA